ncbi:MAG: hypothetical protein IJR66_04385 [Clostridia bacterium]|nr:hypothetical protein [Clostridia bacterium]
MKKLICIILAVLVSVFSLFLFACEKNAVNEGQTSTGTNTTVSRKLSEVRVVAPDGAPALAISKYIADNETFDTDTPFLYSVVSSSDIGVTMAQGNAELIVVPVNLASKTYKANKNDPYKMVSVITHGNLYIASKEETSLSDLVGKVIGVIGEGLVPDLTLKYILNKNGISYETSETAISGKVAIKYFNNASDLMPMMKQNRITVGLLPEPAVSKLPSIAPDYTFRLDLGKEYDENNEYPQAVLMAKKSFIENDNYAGVIEKMKATFNGNVTWAKENVESAVNGVNGKLKEGLTPSLTAQNITASVIDGCHIYWKDSSLSRDYVKDYINNIIAVQSNSAVAISDDFFM